jgi:hypothetical protein
VIITFDIELIKRSKNIEDAFKGKVGLGCAVLWDDDRPHVYNAKNHDDLIEHLESASRLVSYNGREFDIPVLEAIFKKPIDEPEDHYDILQEIWKALPHKTKGYSLDNVAHRTLDRRKQRESAGVPELFQRGRWAEGIDHCIHDVFLTRKLYDHIDAHGWIIDHNGEQLELRHPDDLE